ncbi:hypothetical protein WUBG_16393 [Wuchereria bancrofti]|uniref:Uncharacterized protein n=1 Tax=Wuchereria bancrofti TaxID=6293 RepID=J9AF78_WUCBA|nr:hypothetical protein WUBG_16393 [Wuchereria bancrofti]
MVKVYPCYPLAMRAKWDGVMKRRRDNGSMVAGRNALIRAVKTLLAAFCFYALGLFNCITYSIRRQYRNVCFASLIFDFKKRISIKLYVEWGKVTFTPCSSSIVQRAFPLYFKK